MQRSWHSELCATNVADTAEVMLPDHDRTAAGACPNITLSALPPNRHPQTSSSKSCSIVYSPSTLPLHTHIQSTGKHSVSEPCIAGCDVEDSGPPAEGDVRLVPLNGNSPPTAACDDVHFGGVELFHDGRWGRICLETETYEFTLDAQVVCRQLGFPFGGVLDAEEASSFSLRSDYIYDYLLSYTVEEAQPVWATQVRLRSASDSMWCWLRMHCWRCPYRMRVKCLIAAATCRGTALRAQSCVTRLSSGAC